MNTPTPSPDSGRELLKRAEKLLEAADSKGLDELCKQVRNLREIIDVIYEESP